MTNVSTSSGQALRAVAALAFTALTATSVAGAQRPAPAWIHGGTCYEVFVRSFQDSNGDGIGDLNGLTQKLDYINDGKPDSQHSLGANCIWLMPIMESPSYHGYDATDYYKVEPDYGTNEDFKRFMAAAHKRGIKVLIDMVLNHTSDQHPWFQAALHDTASPYRSWYRFASPKPEEKGPWGQDPWIKSPVRDEYYYAVFWKGMPDLNYETPAVLDEVKKIAKYWVDSMGVDGFRLDAVRYLMEDHGMKQDSPGTHELLHEYNAYVDSILPTAYTVGEVYADVNTMLPYYPDQLDSYFGFEAADSILSAARHGSAKGLFGPILHLQSSVPMDRYSPFVGNHDRPRPRTDVGGDLAKSRVAHFLVLTMPGFPFVYYGDEIGMVGNKPDERLRTPMQWRAAAGEGFTTGKAWESFQPDSASITVAAQDNDPKSLLNLVRKLIHLRASNAALAGGTLIPLTASNDAVAAYLRRNGDHVVLVVANLSDKPLRGVTLSSEANAIPAGRWTPLSLLGSANAGPMIVPASGMLSGYVPLPTLAPEQGYLFDLSERHVLPVRKD